VGVAARFAAGLQRADATELGLVSKDFECMGDLVAAADSAAHAALIYRRRDLRGSSLASSARAEELARRCAGAVTPALRQGSERLPLTDREREVVMLIGEGMSNRDIAIRLTVSVRTIETHVYRAMAKTNTATRDELATLLTSRRTERQ
jgi:DNA-binding CsgD family transcriptional regulator